MRYLIFVNVEEVQLIRNNLDMLKIINQDQIVDVLSVKLTLYRHFIDFSSYSLLLPYYYHSH